MAFMVPEIVDGLWIEIDGNCGIDYVTANVVSVNLQQGHEYTEDSARWAEILEAVKDFTENTRIETVKLVKGFGCQLSAPGYMDQTGWSVYDTLAEAAAGLLDNYYDMPDDELSDDDERSSVEALEALAGRQPEYDIPSGSIYAGFPVNVN